MSEEITLVLDRNEAGAIGAVISKTSPESVMRDYPELSKEEAITICSYLVTAYMQVHEAISESDEITPV